MVNVTLSVARSPHTIHSVQLRRAVAGAQSHFARTDLCSDDAQRIQSTLYNCSAMLLVLKAIRTCKTFVLMMNLMNRLHYRSQYDSGLQMHLAGSLT